MQFEINTEDGIPKIQPAQQIPHTVQQKVDQCGLTCPHKSNSPKT